MMCRMVEEERMTKPGQSWRICCAHVIEERTLDRRFRLCGFPRDPRALEDFDTREACSLRIFFDLYGSTASNVLGRLLRGCRVLYVGSNLRF